MLGAQSRLCACGFLGRSYCVACSLIAGWRRLALSACARIHAASRAWASRINGRLCRRINWFIWLRVCIWSIRVGFRRRRFCGRDARLAFEVPLFPTGARIDLCNGNRISRHLNKSVALRRVALNDFSHGWQHFEEHRWISKWCKHTAHGCVCFRGALRIVRRDRHRDSVFWRHGESRCRDSTTLERARRGARRIIGQHDGYRSPICGATCRNCYAAGTRDQHFVTRERDEANCHLLAELLLRGGQRATCSLSGACRRIFVVEVHGFVRRSLQLIGCCPDERDQHGARAQHTLFRRPLRCAREQKPAWAKRWFGGR